MSFYTQNKQQFHSKFHKSMISMYCSFHLKLCIFLSMYPQKSCTIQDKCEVKYVKLWSLSVSITNNCFSIFAEKVSQDVNLIVTYKTNEVKFSFTSLGNTFFYFLSFFHFHSFVHIVLTKNAVKFFL